MSKLFYKSHKTPSSSTAKHLEPAVLKQTRKQQELHCKDVQALPYRYAATSDHNKPHNLKTVNAITFTLPTERTIFTLDSYLKKTDNSPGRAQAEQTTTHSKSKNRETGNKKERVCERALLATNSLKKTR